MWTTLFLGTLAAVAGDAAGGNVVFVADASHREALEEVANSVGSQLVDLPVQHQVVWLEAMPEFVPAQLDAARGVAELSGRPLAIYWVDASQLGQWLLCFYDPARERLLQRQVPLSYGSSEGHVEAVAIIVRSATRSLLQGDVIGDLAVSETAPAGSSAAGANVDQMLALEPGARVSLGYRATWRSLDLAVDNGLAAELGVSLNRLLSVQLSYQAVLPQRYQTRWTDTVLQRHVAVLGPMLAWTWGDLRVGGGVALWADYVTQATTAVSPHIVPTDERDVFEFALAPLARLEYDVFGNSYIFLGAQGRIPLARRRIVTDTPEGKKVLMNPAPFQPVLEAGVGAKIF